MVPNGRGRRKNNTRAPLAASLFRRLAAPGRGQKKPWGGVTDDRCAPDNGCLRHCDSCGSRKYFEEAARWTSTPNDHREIKGAESIAA
ncbi:hypothetical protein T03_14879 [Trichinella britovi]|uniref:Uncharacterized protein n=1 Tax=Trichinella britovi TaxID=45882 RepID=A0A0V1CCK7_TRIBR|nr:hypothetical protein T03_12379 [Trichinella britovi]KRY59979.1 hypothetical protein T03_14879 [Trichinella britovi]